MIVLPDWPRCLITRRISIRTRGIEPAGRLVEQQHLRIVQQHAGQAEPLRHAAGKARGQRVALVVQVDQVEHFVADLPPLGPVDPIGGGEELEILDHLHVVVDAEEIGHEADQPADFLRPGVDRVAADVGLAPGGIEQRGQDLHRGGLARPVRPDEAEHVPRLELDVERFDGEQLAVFLREVAGLDHA